MSPQYKQPGRLNVVSFLFILAALAGAYGLFQFGPVYYRKWKAAGVVSDIANKLYAARRRGPEAEEALRQELLTRLGEIGISEAQVQATFQRSPTSAIVNVSYREVVQHPVIKKVSTLEFMLSEDVQKQPD